MIGGFTLTKELTPLQRKKIKEIIGECERCGSKENLEVNRIHRGNQGGLYTLRNIQILCDKCHDLTHYKEPGLR